MEALEGELVKVYSPGEMLPVEYKTVLKIRDLWANGLTDDEVRDLLSITKTNWDLLMQVVVDLATGDRDNTLQYEKFKVKTAKRGRELEGLRLLAEGREEIGNAIKCHQIGAEMDKSLVEVGQKLGVLKGEVIKIQGEVKHSVELAAIFAHLTPDKQKEA